MHPIKESCLALSLALACLYSASSFASGYSEYENHRIWELRLAAQQYAAQESQKKCNWTPKSPVTFSDQLPADWQASNEGLFLRIMSMLRLDQNARDIYEAIGDDKSRNRVREVDADNLPALKSIISSSGFPTPSEVGEAGTHAVLLMVAHMDQDIDFQKSVALEMDRKVVNGTLPAFFPLILKTIRPQITGAQKIPDGNASEADMETYASPKDCYSKTRKDFFNSYIRDRYKESD